VSGGNRVHVRGGAWVDTPATTLCVPSDDDSKPSPRSAITDARGTLSVSVLLALTTKEATDPLAHHL